MMNIPSTFVNFGGDVLKFTSDYLRDIAPVTEYITPCFAAGAGNQYEINNRAVNTFPKIAQLYPLALVVYKTFGFLNKFFGLAAFSNWISITFKWMASATILFTPIWRYLPQVSKQAELQIYSLSKLTNVIFALMGSYCTFVAGSYIMCLVNLCFLWNSIGVLIEGAQPLLI